MEEMQQKGEAWKVLHHLYITYKEKKLIMHNTKQLSHLYPLSYAHHTAKHSRQVEQKPGGRGREYDNLPFKMHCDSIITRSCWIGD